MLAVEGAWSLEEWEELDDEDGAAGRWISGAESTLLFALLVSPGSPRPPLVDDADSAVFAGAW